MALCKKTDDFDHILHRRFTSVLKTKPTGKILLQDPVTCPKARYVTHNCSTGAIQRQTEEHTLGSPWCDRRAVWGWKAAWCQSSLLEGIKSCHSFIKDNSTLLRIIKNSMFSHPGLFVHLVLEVAEGPADFRHALSLSVAPQRARLLLWYAGTHTHTQTFNFILKQTHQKT